MQPKTQPKPKTQRKTRVWIKRFVFAGATAVLLFLLVVLPVGGSFLITNGRFRFPETSGTLPLGVEEVGFASSDGIRLSGWWSAPEGETRGMVVFVHGLNRSRMEMLSRAVAVHELGFATLLFDLRNHGQSGEAYTTLGVYESRDVCAAARFARSKSPGRPLVLWGVSMGASSALLGARCAEADAVVSDSSFLSFSETVRHHFGQIFGLPAFPVADLLILVTRLRMGFSLRDGDVEAAVGDLADVPVLFVAGGDDWRMPPDLAGSLREASAHPQSRMIVIEGATHGHAFEQDPDGYLGAVTAFFEDVLPPAAPDTVP